MTNIIKQNYLENFPNNEGRVNSKGIVAPPVPPRAPETKLSSQNGATKPKLASNPNEGKQFKYEVKLPGVIHTTARKNNVEVGSVN